MDVFYANNMLCCSIFAETRVYVNIFGYTLPQKNKSFTLQDVVLN